MVLRCVWVRSVCVLLPVTRWLLGYDPDEEKRVGGFCFNEWHEDKKWGTYTPKLTYSCCLKPQTCTGQVSDQELRGQREGRSNMGNMGKYKLILTCSELQAFPLPPRADTTTSPHCSANPFSCARNNPSFQVSCVCVVSNCVCVWSTVSSSHSSTVSSSRHH